MADDEPKHPSSLILLLIAAAIIAAVAGLLVLLTRIDPAGRVIGHPMEFRDSERDHQAAQPPTETLAETPGPVAEPRQHDVDQSNMPEELPPGLPEELIDEVIDEIVVVRAPVHEVVGDHLFWIGAGPEQRVPVLLLGERTGRQPEQQIEIEQGQQVEILGIVRTTNPAALFQGSALLSDSERRDLLSSKVYISALRVITLPE